MEKRQEYKRFWMGFAGCMLVMLVCVGVINYVTDPMYHYRAPIGGMGAYLDNAIYQTPGAARHLTYDSVITGTSMTENFHASWFEEMGLHTLKLSYAGGRCKDIRTVLDAVFDSDNDVKLVLMDVDDYQLNTNPEEQYKEQPDYLYDGSAWRDVQYLWNSDVFWISIQRIVQSAMHRLPDLDDSYVWEDPALFSAAITEESCSLELFSLYGDYIQGILPEYDMQQGYDLCRRNLEQLLAVIEEHPETEFIIYYPPYSVRYWERQILSNRLDYILELYRYSAELFLSCENVKVYYFQDEEEWIANLDNYRDECHHSPRINRQIFEAIRDGRNELTPGNLQDKLAHMRQLTVQYAVQDLGLAF